MRYRGWLGVLVLVGLQLPNVAVALPVGGGTPAIIPLPGGIADPSGRVGYVTSAAGGIEALDLITGDVLWESNEAQLPLLVAGERLYAQAGLKRNRIRVLVYDLTRKGDVLLESEPIVFPEWVITGEAPGHSFQADWRLDSEQLVLSWKANAWYVGKEKAIPLLETQDHKQAAGVVKIDLKSGKHQHSSPELPGATIGIGVPELKELEKKAVRWQGVVGGQYKAVVLGQFGDKQKVLLMTWDRAGAPRNPPQELHAGKQLTVLATLDNRMVCVRDALPSPDQRGPAVEAKKYAWTIYSLETGEKVAQVNYQPGTQALIILGPRLFLLRNGPVKGPLGQPFENTRYLEGIDVKTGRVLWEHAVASKTGHPPAR